MRLRRRLNTVLLQWFLLLVLITGTVWVISFPGIRKNLVDERLLLARTIAHSLDTTISSAVQDLDRLVPDLPASDADVPARLHAFRLSPRSTTLATSSTSTDWSSRLIRPASRPCPRHRSARMKP